MFTSEKAGRKKEKRAKSLGDRESLTKAKSEENQMQRVDEPREQTPEEIKVKDEEGDVLHTCAESPKIPQPEHVEKQLYSTSGKFKPESTSWSISNLCGLKTSVFGTCVFR
jgi:hypothetical protein